MKKLALLITVSAIFITSCKNEEKINLNNFNDSLSYAIGNDIAGSFKQSKLDSLDIDILAKAIKDNFAEDSSVMSNEAISQILMTFSQKMRAEAEAERIEQNKIQFKDNLETGQKFLEENSKKEGVITTESGLQYKIIKKGKGESPKFTDKVKVHYEGTLLDGTKFDSSYDKGEPAEFGVTQVIKGWTEALQLMKKGSEWELYIPYDLAYGDRGSGSIKPFSALIFKVELISIIETK
ncbi:MAG: FKBP-type peptidyl-prolyl cis-trans isomerase [Bacteroidales bacterium]|nr:FKBP-type peptidyl-prolyl cis-trans isomerase [Bacteroidales bacterium]